jgi:hypothetical protein
MLNKIEWAAIPVLLVAGIALLSAPGEAGIQIQVVHGEELTRLAGGCPDSVECRDNGQCYDYPCEWSDGTNQYECEHYYGQEQHATHWYCATIQYKPGWDECINPAFVGYHYEYCLIFYTCKWLPATQECFTDLLAGGSMTYSWRCIDGGGSHGPM